MDDRSVASQAQSGDLRWKLKPEHAKLTQGLVASPFAKLPHAEALFLRFPADLGGGWLRELREGAGRISYAVGKSDDNAETAIAFTWTGLQAMNLPDEALASFSAPFTEGMLQQDRRRRLGDLPDCGTVVDGGPRWWGGTPNEVVIEGEGTPDVIHCALILYGLTNDAVDLRVEEVTILLDSQNIVIAHHRRLSMEVDGTGVLREHFGFADGVSQPVPVGDGIDPPPGPGAEALLHWHGVPAGEILFGHKNAYDEPAPGPVVPASANPGNVALSSEGVPEGCLNLGLNGSYVVIRELRQDVAGFWNWMETAAREIGEDIDPIWLAERVIGRTLDGATLKPGGTIPTQNGLSANSFGFAEDDVYGFGCPLGAHIRRANPRDSLPSRDGAEPKLADAETLLRAANAHRILRRSRSYGKKLEDTRHHDDEERGLMFVCLNTDLARHFEFVQQTWLLNPNFATLSDETDPLLGPAGPMTIPGLPLRRKTDVATFVQLVGGEYFFLPSLLALDYLEGLSPAAET